MMPVMRLDAFAVTPESIVSISPAPARRAWMEATHERFANRCLPLLMANQAGWMITLEEPVTVTWSGRDGQGEVSVEGSPRVQESVASHFGSGIVTFKLPWLFRAEPGYNLLVRGPVNLPKDGIAPLEGIVEVDWSFAPFTMNWQITRPRVPIHFSPGEAIAMLVPQRRGELEAFDPRLGELDDDREIAAAYRAWREDRARFLRDLAEGEEAAVKAGWQKDYFQGKGPLGRDAGEATGHQTKMTLSPFRRR